MSINEAAPYAGTDSVGAAGRRALGVGAPDVVVALLAEEVCSAVELFLRIVDGADKVGLLQRGVAADAHLARKGSEFADCGSREGRNAVDLEDGESDALKGDHPTHHLDLDLAAADGCQRLPDIAVSVLVQVNCHDSGLVPDVNRDSVHPVGVLELLHPEHHAFDGVQIAGLTVVSRLQGCEDLRLREIGVDSPRAGAEQCLNGCALWLFFHYKTLPSCVGFALHLLTLHNNKFLSSFYCAINLTTRQL